MLDIDFLHDAKDIMALAPSFTEKLKDDSCNPNDVEILRRHGDFRIFSARENFQARIIFTIVDIAINNRNYKVAHFIDFLPTHNYKDCPYIDDASAFLAYINRQIPDIQSSLEKHLANQLCSSSIDRVEITPVQNKKHKPIVLTSEQELVLQERLPLYVNGCGGAGKTTLVKPLFEKQLQDNPKLRGLYITFSPLLVADVSESLQELQENITVTTFASLYLRKAAYATNGVISLDAILAWIDNNRGALRQEAIVIFQAFQIIAAIGEERYRNENFKRGAVPLEQELRNNFLELYKKFKTFLIKNKYIDVHSITFDVEEDKYDVIIVDEAQNISLSMLLFLIKNVDNNKIILLGDENQRTHSVFPLIDLAKLYINFEPVESLLKTSKRCAPRIIAFSNQLLSMKIDTVGGSETSSSIIKVDADPDARHQGRVSFKITKETDMLRAFNDCCAELIQKNILFAVLVLDPKLKAHIRAPVVLTVHEAEGLEYPVVITFAPFDSKSWRNVNERLAQVSRRSNCGSSSGLSTSKMKTPKSKTLDYMRFVIAINMFYVIATRPRTHLHFFFPQLDKKLPQVWEYLVQVMIQGAIFESEQAQHAAAADLNEHLEKARQHFLLGQMDTVEGIWQYHFRNIFLNIDMFKARLSQNNLTLPLPQPPKLVSESASPVAKPNKIAINESSTRRVAAKNNPMPQQKSSGKMIIKIEEINIRLMPEDKNSRINYLVRMLKKTKEVHLDAGQDTYLALYAHIKPDDIQKIFKLDEKQIESTFFNVYLDNKPLINAIFDARSHKNAFWHYAQNENKYGVLVKIINRRMAQGFNIDFLLDSCPEDFFIKLNLLDKDQFIREKFSDTKKGSEEITRLQYLLSRNPTLLRSNVDSFVKNAVKNKWISLSIVNENKLNMDIVQYALVLGMVSGSLYMVLGLIVTLIGYNLADVMGNLFDSSHAHKTHPKDISGATEDDGLTSMVACAFTSVILAWLITQRYCSYKKTPPIECTILADGQRFILPPKSTPFSPGFFPKELSLIAKHAKTTPTPGLR